ncbi:MAG: 16S rRNA (guanine(966)-N(2))-methyltransferase RsmD [Phycisphaerae bacterium]|jgi:16S rRNA (guanine966-N2)-methyltransferase
MRIIAGAKRGMKLLSPKTDTSRPITDRVKESLFDVLWNYGFPEGKIAADLFCGVGSLGLEALSRGAEFVAFVEKDPRIIATLKNNIEKAGFTGESKVIRADAFKIGAPAYRQKYNLVFVDPPYAASRDAKEDSPLGKLLVLLTEQLSPDGIVVVRTEKRIELLEQYGGLKVIERRQWGTMAVAILHRSSK